MKARLSSHLRPSGSSPTPVLAYPVPAVADGAGEKVGKRRGGTPGLLKVHSDEHLIREMQALAQCMGTTLTQFSQWGLQAMKRNVEAEIGITGSDALKLTRAQRAHLGNRVRAVCWVAFRNTFFPAKN
jgi:hypothetical protein